jgi:hypothetical protein
VARPTLRNNPKFTRLVRALGGDVSRARGCLEQLWDVAYENGNEFIGDSDDVEFAAHWVGEPGILTQALLDAGGPARPHGFIEKDPDRAGCYRVHDLWDHAPLYVEKRAKRESEREAKGKTLSDLRREAGRKGAKSRWGDGKEMANGEHLPRMANGKRMANGITPAPAPAPAPINTPTADAVEGGGIGALVLEKLPFPAPRWALQELWNEITKPPLPRWEEMNQARERAHRARLKERPVDGPTGWREVITRISRSRYCHQGSKGDWKANPEWLLRPGTASRVLEGEFGCAPSQPVETQPCEVIGCRTAAAEGKIWGRYICQLHAKECTGSPDARLWIESRTAHDDRRAL